MAQSYSGSGKSETPSYKTKGEKLTKALVIEEVRIIEVPKVYEVPVIKTITKEQVKYDTKTASQVKYRTVEKETVKYVPKEEETTKYNVVEMDTIKYVPIELKVEKPVAVDKPYERPVIVDKEYTIASIKDMENVRKLMELLPKLSLEVDNLRTKVAALKDVKLVEKVIEAPKVQWINTPVERIVWKDVERERPK